MLRRKTGLLALVLVLVLVAAACGDDSKDDKAATTSAPAKTTTTKADSSSGGIRVKAGMNDSKDKNIAVLAFLPAKVAIKTGEKVTWDWSDTIEPHSVTFAADGKAPPPGPPDEKLFAPTPPTGPYDATALVNSGLQPLGPAPAKDFEVSFSKPGTYEYFCAIHPLMRGEVTVAASGGDTAAEVASRGDDEADKWLDEGRTAKEAFRAKPV